MSMPFQEQEFTFTQPDGTPLKVRGTGNQHHAVFETLDGYTVVEDPATGFYTYAQLDAEGDMLRPLGVRPGQVAPGRLGLQAHQRVRPEAARSQAGLLGLPLTRSRWQERRRARRLANLTRRARVAGVQLAPPQRETVGDYVGLCLLVEFPDVPGTITRSEVDAFCNQAGYTGFGNHGSVRDYFFDVSGGKLRYTNVVAPYYKAAHPRAYYTDESVRQPIRALELIKEALASLKAQGFDFSALTADDQGFVYAANVFYAGPRVNNWAKGLWPHSSSLAAPFAVAAHAKVNDYQITDMGSELTLATFCHENGHMICDFPDLYDYGYESSGVGAYCLMCTGGNPNPRNPAEVGAYLKMQAGWANTVTRLSGPATVTARANDFYLLEKNEVEYYVIERRHRSGRDASLPDAGLAVWHVDELGDNSREQMTAEKHYECSLVQADGRFDLERRRGHGGDATDLFKAGGVAVLNGSGTPNTAWWDGTPSGLELSAVGAPGDAMTFTVKA